MSISEPGGATALFARVRPELVRYVARLTGDADLAEDVAQETFVRLTERPPPDMSGLRGWLFRVATNLARDTARSDRRHASLLAGAADRVPTGDPPADPARLVEQGDVRKRVREALNTLSDKERVALLMREEGFTHREIAEAVGTTTQSVGWLLARALEKMAERLEGDVT